jgi:hypothetical protein
MKAQAKKVTSGYEVKVTPEFVREHSAVMGICSCGKPAQVVAFIGGKFTDICHDCDEK